MNNHVDESIRGTDPIPIPNTLITYITTNHFHIITAMNTYTYYDEHDCLCYYTGTLIGFLKFLEDNPEYTR